MRREVGKLVPATWLDGVVAGLGAAAVCACFAFEDAAAQIQATDLGLCKVGAPHSAPVEKTPGQI